MQNNIYTTLDNVLIKKTLITCLSIVKNSLNGNLSEFQLLNIEVSVLLPKLFFCFVITSAWEVGRRIYNQMRDFLVNRIFLNKSILIKKLNISGIFRRGIESSSSLFEYSILSNKLHEL